MAKKKTTETETKTEETAATPPPPVDPRSDWQGVADASMDAGDPPPRKFQEVLTCILSDTEKLGIGLKYADAVERRTTFQIETKSLMQDRKSELAKIVAEEEKLRDAFRTGRIDRSVAVMETTSFRLGKKWKMRLDTGENYDEKALSGGERQGSLPKTQQLPLGGVANDESGGEEDAGDPEEGTEIDDPQGMLEEAEDDGGEDDDGGEG